MKPKPVIILRSSNLLQLEGNPDASGYKYSRHKKGIENTERALDEVSIPYVIWEEQEITTSTDSIKDDLARIIIVPEMRTCGENTFQKLKELAEIGWIIFSIFDSFYYNPPGKSTKDRYIKRRTRDLFQLESASSDLETRRNFSKIELTFPKTRFAWLTNGLPDKVIYSDTLLFGLIGNSKYLSRHGDARCIKKRKDDSGTEKIIEENYPVFLIREYDSGGLFIYMSVLLRQVENSKQILKNLYQYRVRSKTTYQNKALTWIVIVETAVIFLLLAKDLLNFGTPLVKEFISAVIGGVVGLVITRLATLIGKLLHK